MDAEVTITSVDATQTRNGNTRWTVKDDGGREYTTFRPAIGQAAEQAEGSRARIAFHEEERNGFRNVYLDAVERIAESTPPGSGSWAATRRARARCRPRRPSRSSSRSRTW